MGGVGKTLLLQKVDGSPAVRRHFQGAVFIWLTVRRAPDLISLYRTLSKKLGLEPETHGNPEDYKRYLHTQFIERRVFLVLDDVWEDKAFDSLDLAKGKGSVTLLSTRNQSLLERGSPHMSQVHITPLSKEDSWSLFCVHAFGESSNVSGEVEILAHRIAEECKGLPLALKVIGRAMNGKISPELEWEPVLKKLRQSRMQERTVEEELYECLKLGYDVLSEDDERLKDCFLHFAAFPEDHEFSFTDIFCHWVGEGWISGNGEDDPRADAFSLLKKLCQRSLIESIQLEEKHVVSDEYFLAFKIHDVMRDVAFYILKKDDKSLNSFPKLRILDLRGGEFRTLPEEIGGLKDLVYLDLSECFDLQTIPDTVRNLSKLKCLIIRSCFELKYLPSGVVGLTSLEKLDTSFSLNSFPKLRILDLRNGEFSNLPEEVGELQDLVYLDLSECFHLQTIPDTVQNLRKLKCLMLWRCLKLKYLPSGVVGLTSLQKLDTRACENLSNLKILHLNLGNLTTLPVNMPHWLMQLQELHIGNRDSLKYLPKSFTRCGAFPALINLKIHCSDLVEFPEVEDGALSKLRILHFGFCYSLKTLPLSLTRCGAFPALISLKIYCTSLVEFPEVEDGALSKLRILYFGDCYSLKTLPLSLNYLTNLKKLVLNRCQETLYESCMQNCEK
ncbi:unnamed protein product, partial [Sphagnum tenellum]